MAAELPQFLARLRRPEAPGKGPLRYVRRPSRARAGTEVQPLRGGEQAFPEMLAAIRLARRFVHLEVYILRNDDVGRMFQDALCERAAAGIDVRVLYDAVGSIALSDAFLAPLRAAGVHLVQFHPVAPWRARWGWNKRNHKKILVVDDKVAFTGGLNLGVEYLPREHGGGGWLDWHARVEGTAVYDLARSFRNTWMRAGGGWIPEPARPGAASGRTAAGVEVVDNLGVRARWRMHRAYLYAIRQARREISILNAYFVPELNLRRAFAKAVQRGVSLRVIVPSTTDVPAVRHASRHLYRRLIESGVRIFEWPETMMHAKVGIIDGAWSTIGSYNLDHRSLMHNLEIGVVCADETLAGTLQEAFERDVARCREVTVEELQRLSAWQRWLDWGWYQLRSWL